MKCPQCGQVGHPSEMYGDIQIYEDGNKHRFGFTKEPAVNPNDVVERAFQAWKESNAA